MPRAATSGVAGPSSESGTDESSVSSEAVNAASVASLIHRFDSPRARIRIRAAMLSGSISPSFTVADSTMQSAISGLVGKFSGPISAASAILFGAVAGHLLKRPGGESR